LKLQGGYDWIAASRDASPPPDRRRRVQPDVRSRLHTAAASRSVARRPLAGWRATASR